ncbi:hypothetical protein RHGRI_036949 [Rhododendron griersonianum]|uniref:Uncharacterized protein n=1 Tax=Rhododendron griersonianum TaxID=479676 RepID=A0AAV6HVP0_9ERIC|nr:hypothetical protein RHGRI_036949 [Rhododendron griersonianum]
MAKNRSPRMRFACERGGKYRPFINKANDKGGNVKENGKEGKAKNDNAQAIEITSLKGAVGYGMYIC